MVEHDIKPTINIDDDESLDDESAVKKLQKLANDHENWKKAVESIMLQ